MGVCVGSLSFCVVLGVLTSLAIIWLRKRESCVLYFICVKAVYVLCLFLLVLWGGLQSVVVAFPGHSHF